MKDMSGKASCLIGSAAAAAVVLATLAGASHAQGLRPVQSPVSLFSVSGQVVDALEGYFVLKSESSRTNIRLRGWPRDLPDGRSVLGIGDNVMAIGWLTEDTLTDGGFLDVVGIYVEDRRAYFALSRSADGAARTRAPLLPPSGGFDPVGDLVSVTGVIGEVATEGFTLRAGDVSIAISTSSLNYDPFDEIGSQRLNLGDTVTVDGLLEKDAEGELRLHADRVTSIFMVSIEEQARSTQP